MNALVKSEVLADLEILDTNTQEQLACVISEHSSCKYHAARYSKLVELLSSKLTNKQLQHVTWHKFTSDEERQEELGWYRRMRSEYTEREKNARIALQAMGLLSL